MEHEDVELNKLLTNIGKKVKLLRESHGLSQEELSFNANIHRTQVSRIENGSNNISMKSIYRLTTFFEIDYPEFFDFKNIK
jgi:transcriptional regulator with XRE-family HTH domain